MYGKTSMHGNKFLTIDLISTMNPPIPIAAKNNIAA